MVSLKTVQNLGFDLLNDPYAVYWELRAAETPLIIPGHPGDKTESTFIFSRFDDVSKVLLLTDQVSNQLKNWRDPSVKSPFDESVLQKDSADHLRLRKVISDFFSPNRINRLEITIRKIAEKLSNSILGKEQSCLIKEFAELLPLEVIGHLVGIETSRLKPIRQWTLDCCGSIDDFTKARMVVESREAQKNFDFVAFANDLLEEKRARPGDDLASHLLKNFDHKQLTKTEMTAAVVFVLFAGHETTVNLIGNGLFLLYTHPEQLTLLSAKRDLYSQAVEEILRYESPIQRVSDRILLRDISIGSHNLKKGSKLNVFIGAANRDDRVFNKPDFFCIDRSPCPHLAFGAGIHNCLGKRLARIEGRIALETAMKFFHKVKPKFQVPQWRKNTLFRGLDTLIVQRS